MSSQNDTFSSLVSLSGIEYPQEIDLGLVGCYVYHNGELLDVLVLSDAEQKLRMKNLNPIDLLRFECKLLGTKQKFLGSVSFNAEKLLAIAPNESWSQLFPLFDEGDVDEYKRDFGDIKVVPPCILLTFTPTELGVSSISGAQTTTVTKVTKTTKTKKGAAKTTKSKKEEKSKEKSKKKQEEVVKKAPLTLEERVVEKIDQLGEQMGQIQNADLVVVDRLDVLAAHHDRLQQRHPVEDDKRKETAEMLSNLIQAIGDDSTEDGSNDENPSMKAQDRIDVDELGQSKAQLLEDVNAATGDLDNLVKDTAKIEELIKIYDGKSTDKSGQNNISVQAKQKAIRAFLLNTLNNSDEANQPIYQENGILRGRITSLRQLVRDKFLNADTSSDEEMNAMVQDYEDMLARNGGIFKQLDEEANDNITEFNRHGDLWKKLFGEGMEFERKCDDIEYDVEDLADKEAQLRRDKGDIESAFGDYIGKLKYVNEQQKGIIDELRGEINQSRLNISDLKRQQENGDATLIIESKPFARGRNTKDDPNLINLTNDIIGVHQEKRRAQDEGENIHEDWVGTEREFLDRGYAEFQRTEKDRGTISRIQDILAQISQSNLEIEKYLSEMQRLEREKSINSLRSSISTDMNSDMNELRSRLDSELSKRERIIVELKDYAALQRTKADIYGRQREEIDSLLRDIEELREFLLQRFEDEEAELLELETAINEHKERLRAIVNDINEVRILIVEEEHHNEIKRNLLRNRDEYIERLKIALKDLNKKPVQHIQYIVTPGDDVDAILADKLREFGIAIPLTRLGGGFYLFGTKKIFAKIMNGKLVVRVGGGYMIIDEFLATYSDMELIRINKMMENENVDAYEELKVYKKYKDENPEAFKKIDPKKRTLIKSPKAKPKPNERGKF